MTNKYKAGSYKELQDNHKKLSKKQLRELRKFVL